MDYPALDIVQFVKEYGELDDGEKATATRLLQLVADWIRANAPEATEAASQQVAFEVVRDSLNLSEFAALKQFENTTSRRTQSGTFVDADASSLLDQVVTDRQKRLLGIPIGASASYGFEVDDFALPHERRFEGFGLGYDTRRPYC